MANIMMELLSIQHLVERGNGTHRQHQMFKRIAHKIYEYFDLIFLSFRFFFFCLYILLVGCGCDGQQMREYIMYCVSRVHILCHPFRICTVRMECTKKKNSNTDWKQTYTGEEKQKKKRNTLTKSLKHRREDEG